MAALKRINKELNDIKQNPSANFTVALVDETNLFEFHATINGPDDSPYSGGVFRLSLKLPAEYPLKPPKVKFLTRVYHPNVLNDIPCTVDILFDSWSPALTISKVLNAVISMLADPDPYSRWQPEIS